MTIRNTLSGKLFIAQKLKPFIRDFVCKYDQMCRNLRIWSRLLKKTLKKNLMFIAVFVATWHFFCVCFLLVTIKFYSSNVKGSLSARGKFLVTKSNLKIMKNAFYSTLKVIFVLKIFKLLSWFSDHVEKRLD